MHAVVNRLDEDGDGWPEGSGNVEREGMGVEKLDNSVYLIRGLYDLADLARSEGDRGTQEWASDLASRLHQRFEDAWWFPGSPDGPQYADSIDDPPLGGDNNKQQDTRAARRTSSPARCRRSCRRRTSTARARTTRTSSAAGAAAPCSCRRGATTARSGRSSISSSACGPTWGATRWRSCRSCRRARRSGRDIRLGKGSVDVSASRDGKRYRTEVDADVKLDELLIGHTLPRDSHVSSVRLDGHRVKWVARTTNRGLEVTARAGRGDHVLVVEVD
jgi:hypothetical protein